ncbi:MAG TPA: pilus assembly protein TadG-related protein [Solirubrobacteraceae bacterium]|jgi:Flp pilus assembly protein TadG|nr:pilus assembly protein TadG-related protein [Solirubrobacteraceae bacterium]
MDIQAVCVRLLRRFRSDQSGQSLIIVALAMTVVIAISAFAIDAATWMHRHHQDQLVADAAALAAANCLANPGHATSMNINGTVTSVPACASGTDTTDATTVAEDYAAANGVTVTGSNISFTPASNPTNVTVNPQTTGPTFFANMFGIHTTTQSASAQAGWKAASSAACTAANQAQCSVVYAASTTCASSGAGAVFGSSLGGLTVSVTGAIHSEGSLTFPNSGSNTHNGTFDLSPMTVSGSCYSSGNMPYSNTATATQVASESWPVDYSKVFAACTTNCITVQGVNNVPPYCTQVSTNQPGWAFNVVNGKAELPVTGNVYCAIGSGNHSNPATWNGAITVQSSIPEYQYESSYSGCPSFVHATFIGGNISFFGDTSQGGGDVCLAPQSNNCLIYTTGSVLLTNGNFFWTGDIFAPGPYLNSTDPNPSQQTAGPNPLTYGTIDLGAGTGGGFSAGTVGGLVEGWNVELWDGTDTLTGDGPVMSSSGSSSGGGDFLSQ